MSDEGDRVAMVSDLTTLQQRLDQRIAEVAEATRRQFGALEQRIAEEGETTRRHFDIMVERVESSVKLVAEVNAHHSSVLSNHEIRLQTIEKRRG
jgi:hypothetical protein